MQKFQLAHLATVAVLFFFLQYRVEAESQIDVFFPAEFINMLGEMKGKFSEKCKRAAEGMEKSTIYQDFEQGVIELITCTNRMMNVDFDTFFNKRCTDGIKCLRDFNEKAQPCLNAIELEQNAVTMRIVTSLGGYICSMGSLEVARVFEEGPNCFVTSQDTLNACFRNSFPDIQMSNFLESPDLAMDQSLCVGWEHFQSCTLQQLKRCREKTPASVAETVFKIIKNESSCSQGVTGPAPINAVNLMLSSGVGKVQKNFREKCVKAAKGVENSTIIQDFENGITELETCIGGLAQKLYSNKDCNYGFKCLLDFNKKVQPCFSAKERQQNVEHIPIVTGMLDFMCSMNSSHVMQDEEIRTCFNNSFHFALPKDIKIPNFFDLYTLVMEPSLCVEWENFQSCTIKQLEQFRENAKASVDESVFKIIKNVMGCNQDVNATAPKNAMNLSSDVVGEPIAKNVISFNHNGADTAGKIAMNLMLSSGVMLLVSRLLKM